MVVEGRGEGIPGGVWAGWGEGMEGRGGVEDTGEEEKEGWGGERRGVGLYCPGILERVILAGEDWGVDRGEGTGGGRGGEGERG